MQLDWTLLPSFMAAAEAGGFSEAARRLGTTQPTVTRHITTLEEQLSVTLFVRTPSGVSLTDAGKHIYDLGLTMTRAARTIERSSVNFDKSLEGVVSLIAPDGFATEVLMANMPEFLMAHPGIKLQLECEMSHHESGQYEAEIAIWFEKETHPDSVSTKIARIHYCAACSSDYADIYGIPTSIHELVQHRIVWHSEFSDREESWSPQIAALRDLREAAFETNSGAAYLAAVEKGIGIGAIPSNIFMSRPDIKMVMSAPLVSVDLYMCFHRELQGNLKVQKVRDWLKSVFDPKTHPCYRDEFVHPDEFGDVPGFLDIIDDGNDNVIKHPSYEIIKNKGAS